jgi:hypothetical protein
VPQSDRAAPGLRWAELRAFAGNLSYSWPLAGSQQAAFEDFARIYNATGMQMLAGAGKGATALSWLHGCVFGTDPACAKGSGGGDGGALYSEIVLDECSNTTSTADCQHAADWTAVPADAAGGTIFTSGLSTAKACYAMNVCDVAGECAPVVAYGDATGACSKAARQNTFVAVGRDGLLAHAKGFTTSTCTSKVRQGVPTIMQNVCDRRAVSSVMTAPSRLPVTAVLPDCAGRLLHPGRRPGPPRARSHALAALDGRLRPDKRPAAVRGAAALGSTAILVQCGTPPWCRGGRRGGMKASPPWPVAGRAPQGQGPDPRQGDRPLPLDQEVQEAALMAARGTRAVFGGVDRGSVQVVLFGPA